MCEGENSMIKEVIVVEGSNDISAVKRAVEAEVIITGGFGLKQDTIEFIKKVNERRGVIIFTDPDYAGEKIRQRISREVPGCKHAFLPKSAAMASNGKIGVEHASPGDIQEALINARAERMADREAVFTMTDLMKARLVGTGDAKIRRNELGEILGIGQGNAKKMLQRLNGYQVTRQEFGKALEKISESR